MRLFTGIELSDAVRAEAAAAGEELRRRVDRGAPRARLTWVAPERLHLTVRFIGEVDGVMTGRIAGALRNPLSVAPFTLTFGGFGAFPAKGPPRVLWMGVAGGRDEIRGAAGALDDRLASLGLRLDDRDLSPHVTLARVREAGGLRPAALFAQVPAPTAGTRVDAITLFESRLSPKGPAYVVLERVPLRRD